MATSVNARGHVAHRLLLPVGSAGGALVAVAALLLRDPHSSGSWGICPVLALTGHFCPGCGSLRAVHDLLLGQIGEALGHNLLVVPALIWLGWWWVGQIATTAGIPVADPPSSKRFCWALLAVLAAFVVLRNVSGSPLAP